ncbi:hypothetical protein, partial [Mycolicibacterium palauense]|uniref:hypothetical protein n=1 Tax=Mycolicibacterium palauense TaxID=2034511 RepID=UPI001C3F2461
MFILGEPHDAVGDGVSSIVGVSASMWVRLLSVDQRPRGTGHLPSEGTRTVFSGKELGRHLVGHRRRFLAGLLVQLLDLHQRSPSLSWLLRVLLGVWLGLL